jgi:hypothetical protein
MAPRVVNIPRRRITYILCRYSFALPWKEYPPCRIRNSQNFTLTENGLLQPVTCFGLWCFVQTVVLTSLHTYAS